MSRPPSRLRIALAWLPAILYTLLIWWLSSQSQLDVSFFAHLPLGDKGAHALEYLALGLFLAFAVRTTWPGRSLGCLAAATLMTFTLGIMDELHQAFVPLRSSDVLDLVADLAGALLAALLYGIAMALAFFVARTRRAAAA